MGITVWSGDLLTVTGEQRRVRVRLKPDPEVDGTGRFVLQVESKVDGGRAQKDWLAANLLDFDPQVLVDLIGTLATRPSMIVRHAAAWCCEHPGYEDRVGPLIDLAVGIEAGRVDASDLPRFAGFAGVVSWAERRALCVHAQVSP